MSSIPMYSGKPTLYLDQNILDFFVKNGLGSFGKKLSEAFQVVYSDETLKEIRRSVGYENNFLNVLKDLDAYHLKLLLEPGFIVTDKATITKRDVFEALEELCVNDDKFGYAALSPYQWLFKFSGGRTGTSISDIHAEQLAAFEQLMEDMIRNADELPAEQQRLIKECAPLQIELLRSTLKNLENLISKNVPDTRDWNGIKSFRDAVDIGPIELNNIEGPNVIIKIWDALKSKLSQNDYIQNFDDFFQIRINPIFPDRPYHRHQKVTAMYNMLNTIGYFPDSNVHKEKRFIAAVSDNTHASMASFCDALLSRDKDFVKKVLAVYEYLEVSTKVQLVELIN